MELKKCVEERRSIRKYKNEPVSDGTIEKIVSVAAYSPSWKNSQTTRFVAVSNPALKKELAEKCVMDFDFNKNTILNAPMIILVTTLSPRSGFERDGSPSTSKGTHWESFDAGIATQTLCLAAHEEGLGTVVLGVFDEAKVRDAAKIPADQKVSAMVAIGYPDESPAAPKRKSAAELVSFVK